VTINISGDSFVVQWAPVTKDVDGNNVRIASYQVQFEADGVQKTVSASPQDQTMTYTLSMDQNRLYWGSVQALMSVRVRAISNKEVKGVWSAFATAENIPPESVQNVSATGTLDAMEVSWDANTEDDLAGYRVWVSTTEGFTPNALNLIYEGLGTRFIYVTSTYAEHFFIVRAYNTFGLESADATASATPLSPFTVDITPPATPTGLSASLSNNSNGIGAIASVSWTPPSDADLAGYWVRYRRVGDTPWNMIPVQKDATSAIIELLYAYVNYEFQITAMDDSANYSGWSSTYTASTPTNTPPANVTGLVSTSGKDSITYYWNATGESDLKNYEVTFSTSPTFASGNLTFLTGTAATLTVGGLAYGTTYYARVRAVNQGGLSSPSWSVTDTETTGVAPAPTDGYAPASSPTPNVVGRLNSLYVTWPSVTTNSNGGTQNDAVTYDVHLSTTSGFTPSGATKVTEVTATSTMISNLPGTTTALSYGTTYYVKLVARDRDGSAAAGAQGSGTLSKVASSDVTSIGADLIVPGSGFIANLVINTGGSIQSSNWSSGAAGWKISPTGAEFNDSGSAIKVDALRAGTIGGSSGAGVINVAAGTSLIFNGGYLKSNTNTGTTMSSAVTSGAGFYLGNDGLFIGGGANGGQIKANALISDTLTSTTITLGAGGSIQAGTWSLSSSGLSIPNGGIQAANINITSAFGNSVTSAATTIDGGKITTGSIQSQSYVMVNGLSVPRWSINTQGYASFAGAQILGNTVLGRSSTDTDSYIQSSNYSPGGAGWMIRANGFAEFGSGTFRGDLSGARITSTTTINSGSTYIALNPATTAIEFYSGGVQTGNITSASYSGTTWMTLKSSAASIGLNSANGIGMQGNTNITGSTNISGNLTVSGGASITSNCTFTADVNVGRLVGNTWATGLFRSEQNITTNFNGSTSGGFYDLTWENGGTTTAGINGNGRITRATNNAYTQSSIRFKEGVEDLPLEAAKSVLDMRSVSFYDTREEDTRTRVPGFIAEEAADLGTVDMWVGYEDDGTPGGIRYDKISAAHNMLIKDLYSKNKTLRKANKALKSRVNSLEERMNALEVRLAN
jgi:hypothetical protein